MSTKRLGAPARRALGRLSAGVGHAQSIIANVSLAGAGVYLALASVSNAASAAFIQTFTMAVGGQAQIGPAPTFQCSTGRAPAPVFDFFGPVGPAIPFDGLATCGVPGGFNTVTSAAGPLSDTRSLTSTFTSAFGTGNFTGSASANADYGKIGAKATASFTSQTSTFSILGAEAFGLYRDSMTVPPDAAHPAGTPGTLVMSFAVDGSLSVSNLASTGGAATADVEVRYQQNTGPIINLFRAQVDPRFSAPQFAFNFGTDNFTKSVTSVSGNGVFATFPIPFIYDAPFDFTLGLLSYVVPAITASGTADFISTAELSKIRLITGGQDLTDFLILGASGTTYGPNGVVSRPAPPPSAVPEPSSLAVMLLGLLGVAALNALGRRRAVGRSRAWAAATAGLALVGGLASHPAGAVMISNNVNFAAVNQNPWTGGPAFILDEHFDDLRVNFNVDLPNLNGSPVKLISDFLGVRLPINADVGLGASVSGHFGVDFGLYMHGGRLNVNYPGRAVLDIPTLPGTANTVMVGSNLSIGSQFQPGLNNEVIALEAVTKAGLGYKQEILGAELFTQPFKAPKFATEFPSASAWADVSYAVNAGAFAEATLEVLGECIVCVRKDAKFGDARDFTLLEIDSGGSGNPPKVYFLNQPVANPFKPIELPSGGSIQFSYPDVNVQGTNLSGQVLSGSGQKPVISLLASLEEYVPLVGGLLDNAVGPFSYTLLSTDGGPVLSLYQDMSFTPDPRVRLTFNHAVLNQGADGQFHPTNVVEFDVGDALNIRIPFVPGDLSVQPTYFLNNTFNNETGLSLGVVLNVDALKLGSPFGDLGPHRETIAFNNLARFPLFKEAFSLSLGEIRANPFDLDVSFLTPFDPNQVARQVEMQRAERFETTVGSGDNQLVLTGFQITVRDRLTGEVFAFDAFGDLVTLEAGDFTQTILNTVDDVIVEGVNLGSVFCVECPDLSSLLFEEFNPFLTGGDGARLYLASLFDFPSADICPGGGVACDPILAQSNFFSRHTAVPTVIGPLVGTINVPEPASLSLMLLGLVGLVALGRASGRRGPGTARA